MSGPDVITAIRNKEDTLNASADDTEAKIIVVSAMDDGRNTMSSFRQGAEGYPVIADYAVRT